MKRSEDKAELFASAWRWALMMGEAYQREYHFHPTRKWRFDFAFVAAKVAVEVDGGQWAAGGGRHNTDKDREKLNEAARLGWRVMRFSPEQLRDDPTACAQLVIDALGAK